MATKPRWRALSAYGVGGAPPASVARQEARDTEGMLFSARMSSQHFPYLLLHPYSHGVVSLSSADVRRHSMSQAC
jgi:hypothetical protein